MSQQPQKPAAKPVDQDFDVELVTELIPYATIVPPGTPPPDDPKAILKVVLCDDKPVVEPPPIQAPPKAGTADWLNDLEPPRPTGQTAASLQNETPDWIADVVEIEAALRSATCPPIEALPDWLADIQRAEGIRAPLPPTTPGVLSDSSKRSAAAPMPTPPAAPVPSPASTERNPAGCTNPPALTEDELVKKAIAETGHDPRTGQILDQEQYEKWNALRVAIAKTNQSTITTESIGLVYGNARNALARWVDEDSRRPLIMQIDMEELKRNPEIQAILARFQDYGPIMREKLLHYLEFLVTNRRQYYMACLK